MSIRFDRREFGILVIPGRMVVLAVAVVVDMVQVGGTAELAAAARPTTDL